ncbi:HAMP domain-containing histidine kinase [Bacillus mycoides]|jgi:signal transduction histidine kinase|uniref:HAMP domain-containing sensor histidine kinase n=1 Tax=Bacillus mycoides TaxID=1405 RepID=UPI00187AB67A|nr:HAMP domain-containing sensor histidine kinase [Bacillus mycoides]MBE7147151.1 HAMP domain-containing histidine kinase [Bacillus mycoides]
MKSQKSLLSIFVINYLAIITITIITLFIFVGYILMRLSSGIDVNNESFSTASATDIVRSDYKNIRADATLKIGGWVEIVKNEHIVYTIGEKKDNVTAYNLDTLHQYLNEAKSSDYGIDIAPFIGEDGDQYYCIIKYPTKGFFSNVFTNLGTYTWQGLLLAALFFLIANGCVIFLSIRKLAKPLEAIKQGIRDMTEGHRSVQLDFHTYQEIEEIKNAFNYMVHELEIANEEKMRMEESKKRMLRDMSHDIKTPMTSIIGYSKTLIEQPLEQDKQKLYLSYIYRKSLQLDKLIQDLFQFTKLDSPSYELQLKKEDFVEFIKETIVIYYGEIEEKEFELNIDIPEHPIYLHLDIRQMERAIGNIIANALKYNPAQTVLFISLKEETENIKIQITDNGIGMSPEVTQRIFHEFVRGDKARSSDGGSGLGLAISKRIIELHNGNITVDSKLDRGTIFTISLPKNM